MAIAQASIDRLKAAPVSTIVEQLGGKLKRVGREFVTQCIWHEDSNPSLTINDDKGFCFCHVCRGGGDALAYTMQAKGLGFADAANLAASILGIQLETDGISPEEMARRRKVREDSLAKLQREQDVYRSNLRHEKAGRIRQILKDRGLTAAASKEFGLGYAATGYFDGRITIPILNHRNELVGWTGRATRSKEQQPAKYKNSADGDLFHKKNLVFNEARAKDAARMTGSLIFVEGHLDVVSLWQHGIANVVAMQGTGAPDPIILQRLAKAADNFVLCFDGDEGGKKAIQQFISAAGPMAQKGEIQINVVQMPKGKDPDEVCREDGAMAFHNLVASAMPWLDWVIDYWAAGLDLDNSAHVTAVESELRKVIDGLRSNAVRSHYIDKVARALSRDDKGAKDVVKTWGNRTIEVEERQWQPPSPMKTRITAERRMLRIFVHRPEHRKQLAPLLGRVSHPPLRWLVQRLQELHQHCATDLTPHSIMAVVAAAEPFFLQQLRTIIQPNVHIDDTPGVLRHCADTLSKDIVPELHESDSNQPSAQ